MESRFLYIVENPLLEFHLSLKNKTSDELLPSQSDVNKSQRENNYKFA
jgi:hypothetical protein